MTHTYVMCAITCDVLCLTAALRQTLLPGLLATPHVNALCVALLLLQHVACCFRILIRVSTTQTPTSLLFPPTTSIWFQLTFTELHSAGHLNRYALACTLSSATAFTCNLCWYVWQCATVYHASQTRQVHVERLVWSLSTSVLHRLQVLRILTMAGANGRGGFFPSGFNGKINTSDGYNMSANGFSGYPGNRVNVTSLAAAGKSNMIGQNITMVSDWVVATE